MSLSPKRESFLRSKAMAYISDDLDCATTNCSDPIRDTRQQFFDLQTEESFISTEKPILALDLDETLIHAFKSPPKYPSFEVKIPKFNCTVWVVTRPGVKKFIKRMSEVYELVIYTSSVIEYADAILEKITLRKYFSKIYDRKYCYAPDGTSIAKDLSVIGSDFKRMILIDDTPKHTNQQPDNSMLLPAYRGGREDCWLETICPFLEKLAALDDVRSVNKKFNEFMLETAFFRQYTEEMGKQTKEYTTGMECPEENTEDGLTETAKFQITNTKRMIPCLKKIAPTGTFETSL